jgi:hypothetical protein
MSRFAGDEFTAAAVVFAGKTRRGAGLGARPRASAETFSA